MSFTESDKNDFWDIDKLVPQKKTVAHPPEKRVVGVEFSDGVPETENTAETELSLPPRKRFLTEESYTPAFHTLITNVTVSRFSDPYDFYDTFRKAALLFYDVKGEVSPFVPFYSYMPQYAQLTPEQRAYYFYFRDELRRGVYLKTDCSYLYLYVYEILNLPEKIKPEEGIIRLCRLWGAYRKALPAIDKYFSVWVQDYCLLYRLTPPMLEMRDFLYAVTEKSAFREFFFSLSDITTEDGFAYTLRTFSDYDPRSGKYALGTEKETYMKYMRTALTPVLQDIVARGVESCRKRSVITRDTFPYSLCTQKVKARLKIEYCPLSEDTAVRETVTAAVKYTENLLRAALGVRSRLSVRDLPEHYRRAIDGFFSGILAEAKRKNAEKNKPEYEKKYEALSVGFSMAGAGEIERDSWTTTMKLVLPEAEELSVGASAPAETTEAEEIPPISDSVEKKDRFFSHEGEDAAFLSRCLDHPERSGVVADACAERLNTIFSDMIGDVVLENRDDLWTVIEDYREDVKEWLKKLPR